MLSKLFKSPFRIKIDGTLVVFPYSEPDPFLLFFAGYLQATGHQGLPYSFADGRLFGIEPDDLDGRGAFGFCRRSPLGAGQDVILSKLRVTGGLIAQIR